MILIASFSACARLLPAFSPASNTLVLAEILPDTLAPSACSLALASSRPMLLSVPVITQLCPLSGCSLAAIWLTGWVWLDPLIALLVAAWIFRIGWGLAKKGMEGLVDTALPEEEEQKVRAILEADPRVHVFHKLRSRKSGSNRLIDLHIHLDADMSLAEAHHISHEIEAKIKGLLPRVDVVIHLEPSRFCRLDQDFQKS